MYDRFYDACNSAIMHANHGNKLGVTLWLAQAHKFHKPLIQQARARLEPYIIDELNGYLAMTTKACLQQLGGNHTDALETLVQDPAIMGRLVKEMVSRTSQWAKTVQAGSLAERWGLGFDDQESRT